MAILNKKGISQATSTRGNGNGIIHLESYGEKKTMLKAKKKVGLLSMMNTVKSWQKENILMEKGLEIGFLAQVMLF